MTKSKSVTEAAATLIVNGVAVAQGLCELRSPEERNTFRPARTTVLNSVPEGSILRIDGDTRQLHVTDFKMCSGLGAPHYHFKFAE